MLTNSFSHTLGGSSANFCVCTLWSSLLCTALICALQPPCYPLTLSSAPLSWDSLLNTTWILLFCSIAWKLSQNRKLGQFPGSLLFVSWLLGLLPFVSCCPVSWESLFFILCPIVGGFRWEDKSDPYNYILAGSRGHINIFWYIILQHTEKQ